MSKPLFVTHSLEYQKMQHNVKRQFVNTMNLFCLMDHVINVDHTKDPLKTKQIVSIQFVKRDRKLIMMAHVNHVKIIL